MTRFALSVAGVFAAIALTGCAGNPINARTAEGYFEAGLRAEREGNLPLARENLGRARANVVLGNLGPDLGAAVLYELSRVTGYLGQYDEAETGFARVLELVDEADGRAQRLEAPACCEYARLLHDTGQHARAVPAYERALPALEAVRILERDPIGCADFLDDDSGSLESAGLAQRAAEVARRSVQIRTANPGARAKVVPRRYRS